MTLIFTTISSAADYGNFGRWLLFTLTCICWAAQFACMSLTSAFDHIGKTPLPLISSGFKALLAGRPLWLFI